MCSNRTITWTGPLTAILTIAAAAALSVSAQAQKKAIFGGGLTGTKNMASAVAADIAADGSLRLKHGNTTLKIAPVMPVVPLPGEEREQWTKDMAAFRLDELKDRQVLYAYDFSNEETAEAVLTALNKTAGSAGKAMPFWTAFGVLYETKDMMAAGYGDLYRRAVVPVEWTDGFYEYVKKAHTAEVFAKALGISATTLSKGAFDNFDAVGDWSALAKKYRVKLDEDVERLKSRGLSDAAVPAKYAVAYEAAKKGPLAWLHLKPVGSFVAVDRKLDVSGVEPLRVLTSKKAWLATAKGG